MSAFEEKKRDFLKNNQLYRFKIEAEENKKNKDYSRAGKHFKNLGKKLEALDKEYYALGFYIEAIKSYRTDRNGTGAISLQRYITELYKSNGNTVEVANSLQKSAEIAKELNNDYVLAGNLFLQSAKVNEENGDYIRAARRAANGVEAIQLSNKNEQFGLGIAIRNFIKAEMNVKALFYIDRLHEISDKNYDNHYVSLCNKGFHCARKADINEKIIKYLIEIIIAHFEYDNHQDSIEQIILQYQLAYIEVNGTHDHEIEKIVIDTFSLKSKQKYYIKMLKNSKGYSTDKISKFYRVNYLDSKRKESHSISLLIWKITSNYGENVILWAGWSIFILILFGFIYSNLPCPEIYPVWLSNLLCNINPEFGISSISNSFTPYYFSIVTFTTLGFGDVIPLNLAAQIWTTLEVILGYIMLGGLISIFSKSLFKE